MKVAIVSKDRKACSACRRLAREHGLVYDAKRPDVVITYGGDGTLLHAERAYPGVPKLPLRNSATSRKSHDHPFEEALERLRQGAYSEERHLTLVATVRRGREQARMVALNDIIVRNRNLAHAIRFSVAVDGKTREAHVIGDGVDVATPFGSTAYFRSVARTAFEDGIGVAFNNPFAEAIAPLLLKGSSVVTVTLLRGPAEVAADNRRLPGLLREGDTVTVRRSPRPAVFLRL